MDVVTSIVVWLNALASRIGSVVLAPIGLLPGWLSATIAAAVTGVLLLLVFKYTSHQRWIKLVRDDIKAHLLAMKLFKDSPWVTMRAQGRVFLGAFRLLALSIVPMLVMVVPVCLILGQLALWYQARPLRVGEEAVVIVRLNGSVESTMPAVQLVPTEAAETMIGPVRVPSQRAVVWSLKARQSGYHRLAFEVDNQSGEKELAIGDDFMRVSLQRPGWSWSDALLHPAEAPFPPDSLIRSIEIDYPQRSSWTSGADTWVVYWFLVSMVAAFAFRPWMNVNI